MSPTTQRREALDSANALRAERAEIRKGLRDGSLTLENVLLDPPEALLAVPLLDVLQMDRHRRTTAMWRLNGLAVHEGVNLMLPVGHASEQTRRFAIALGSRYRSGRRRGVMA